MVTGANRGLGFEVARALATNHAAVTLAVRDPWRGAAALEAIRVAVPGAILELGEVDLASLVSVEHFVREYARRHNRLDCLVNNAAVIMVPQGVTADGFELHWGVNHLGHFALSAGLMPLLLAARSPRVVTVTSLLARWGVVRPGSSGPARRYRPTGAYATSKLANLIFSLELNRRAVAADLPLLSLAAHPGYVRTPPGDRELGPAGSAASASWPDPRSWLSQGVKAGAWPILLAAAAPDVQGGGFYGPGGMLGTRGHPQLSKLPSRAVGEAIGPPLWRNAEASCGLAFQIAGSASSG